MIIAAIDMPQAVMFLGMCANAGRPAEQFFLGIAKGDTPATNQFSAIALAWVDEWLANVTNPAGASPAQQRAKGA